MNLTQCIAQLRAEIVAKNSIIELNECQDEFELRIIKRDIEALEMAVGILLNVQEDNIFEQKDELLEDFRKILLNTCDCIFCGKWNDGDTLCGSTLHCKDPYWRGLKKYSNEIQ